jgi:HAD superfamily hydrolase (TIGR01549 family)
MMIRWIFFDMGNVVMNDDPVMAFIYAELHQAIRERGVSLSYSELLAEREKTIRERGPGHWYFLGERYLGTDGLHRLMHHCANRIRGDYMGYHNVLPGMAAALERLNGDLRLGILANQLKESVEALHACGLRHHFEVLAISELIDLKKPEPAIFDWALAEAGCAPHEALMVGDRIDNDIVPARNAGWWTIWFHAPLEEKGYRPPEGDARLYFESQQRASIGRIGPRGPDEMPDGEATSAAELVSEISRLRELSRHEGPAGAAEAAARRSDLAPVSSPTGAHRVSPIAPQ